MIEFLTIKYKNILSYGNNWTTFDFKTGINKISAPNGQGKSSIIDSFSFILFGKPYRKIKTGQLINSKNKKGLIVHLEFKKQDDTFRIERGLKPDVFLIYKNDVLIPVSNSKRGYQEILNEDILGFDENLFNQVTVKSLTKNLSFMTLQKADKRKVVENLFDVEVFGIMSKNVKVKIDKVDLELQNIKKDIDNKNLLLEQELSNIERLRNLKKKLDEESDEMIKQYNTDIENLENKLHSYTKGFGFIEKNKLLKKDKLTIYNGLKSEYSVTQKLQSDVKAKIDLSENKVKFLKNTCNECPKINLLLQDDDILKCNTVYGECELQLSSLKTNILIIETEIKKIDEILSNERFLITSKSKALEDIESYQSKIKNLKGKVIEIDESKIKSYKEEITKLTKEFNIKSKLKVHYVLLRSLYADGGFKSLIIKKYLPHINRLLSMYLSKFNACMIFNFDEEFNEVILTKYKEDYSYFSFSEGEKKRIDLAVLFSFIKFSMEKNKMSNTNLLILDEITSGLDVLGAESLFGTLKDYRNKFNKCIININHNDQNESEYDRTYEVEIIKGFSQMRELSK